MFWENRGGGNVQLNQYIKSIIDISNFEMLINSSMFVKGLNFLNTFWVQESIKRH